MRTVSIAQLADAIEAGGYPLARRYFFKSHPDEFRVLKTDADWQELSPGELIEACAMGQAALNLGVGPNELYSTLSDTILLSTLALEITSENDKGRTLGQIARYIRKNYKALLTDTIELPELDWGKVFSNYKGKKV